MPEELDLDDDGICFHVIHLFPEDEDDKKHIMSFKCACFPKRVEGLEEDYNGECLDVVLYYHNRSH